MTDADYADNLAITSNNDKNAELMFQNIVKIGLQENTEKPNIFAKYIYVN